MKKPSPRALKLTPFEPEPEPVKRRSRKVPNLGFRAYTTERFNTERERRAAALAELGGTLWDVPVSEEVARIAFDLRYCGARLVLGAKGAKWRGVPPEIRARFDRLTGEERDALATIFVSDEHGRLPLLEALDIGRWCPSHGYDRGAGCSICGVPQRVVFGALW